MKKIVLIIVSIGLCQAVSWAQTQYVKEIMSITMRTGPGTGHKIIHMLKSGEKLDILESGDGWTRIRAKNGQEGWVLNRYLTDETPVRPALNALKGKHHALLEEFNRASTENAALKMDNQQLQKELEEKEAAFAKVNSAWETLKTDSAEFITVRNDLENSEMERSELKTKSKELEAVVIKLQNSQILKGISIGAGILLLGMLIGLRFKRDRKRSSLLS
jgi:SH3 domain protein